MKNRNQEKFQWIYPPPHPPQPEPQANDCMKGTPDNLGDGFKTGGSVDGMGSLDKDDGHESMVKEKSHSHHALSRGEVCGKFASLCRVELY